MAERQPPRDEQTCETCDTLQLNGCEDPECPYGDSDGAYYPYANATGFPEDEDRGKTVDRIPAVDENETDEENGMSIPEAIELADYVDELKERRSLARRNRDLSKHSPADYREATEWATVVSEYTAEIEYWEERLEDRREQAVEARRANLTKGGSA